MTDWTQKHCAPCEGGVEPMPRDAALAAIAGLEGWAVSCDGKVISRDFSFRGFYRTMAFVNAIAWVANSEGHHPDMEVGYDHCLVRFTTHSIGGLSENDFICAAKVNALLRD